MQVSRLRIGGAIALGYLVAACAGVSGNQAPTATGSPLLPSTPPASALAEAGPSTWPPGSVTPVTGSGAPLATPVRSLPAATTPSASSKPAPSASSGYPNGEPPVTSWMRGSGNVQAELLADVRDDAKVGCAATPVVPIGAVAGAECHPNTALVAFVDVYGFGSPDTALSAYRARLAASGLGSGPAIVRPGGRARRRGHPVTANGDPAASNRTAKAASPTHPVTRTSSHCAATGPPSPSSARRPTSPP